MLKNLKRYISIMLTAAMLCTSASFLPDNAFNHVGGITVSAETSGDDYTFDPSTGTITGYYGAGGDVVIPASIDGVPVTAIDDWVFYDCSSLVSIEIPNSVITIGNYAFFYCTSLTSTSIPNSVSSIGVCAFSDCKSLASINIPNSVTYIGDSAFNTCESLTTIEIPSSVTSIGNGVFGDCTGLTSVEIPSGITSIGNSAFFGCTNLTSIEIPNSVTAIGNEVFSGCTSLTSINIPSSATTVGNWAFYNCTALNVITYPKALDVSGADIPDTSTQIKYAEDGNGINITDIILGSGKTDVAIPDTIDGKTVIIPKELMKYVTHNHEGGTATCTQRSVCTLCGLEYGELLPHTGGTASCTAKTVCDVCGQEYGDFAAHTLVKTEAVPPTCTAAGNEEYWTCDLCQKLFADENGISEITEIPITAASGHNYVNGKCTVCGVSDPNYSQPPIIYPSIPSNPTTSAATPQTQSKEPSIQGDNDKTGWDIILEIIRNTPDGGTVKVNMNGTSELPKEIVSAIQGRDIELVLDMGGGFVWTVNGMNVIKAKTVNMGVRKLSKIPKSTVQEFFGDSKTVQLDLRHSGDFGFTAELTVDIGSKYNGMYANSYCYQSNDFEFGGSGEIINGQANLLFSHASSWLITIEDSPVQEDVSSAAGVTADSNTIDFDKTVPYNFLSVIIILGIGLVYFKKSRQK